MSQDFLIYVVGRPVLLVFWSFVIWGSIYGLALLYAVMVDGPAEALRQALSGRDRGAGAASLALTGLAMLVWSTVGLFIWRGRLSRKRSTETGGMRLSRREGAVEQPDAADEVRGG